MKAGTKWRGNSARQRAVNSEIARSGAAEELYVFDPQSTRKNLAATDTLQSVKALANVVRAERSLLEGLRHGAKLAAAGRNFIGLEDYSAHVVCTARTAAALEADLVAVRKASADLKGREIVDSIPRTVRAGLFPPPDGVLGPKGDRWAALNAKVANR